MSKGIPVLAALARRSSTPHLFDDTPLRKTRARLAPSSSNHHASSSIPHLNSSKVAGTKRKSTDGPEAVNLDDFDIPNGIPMDSCNVVRGKINRYLESGEMKVGQFCDAIGVSGNACRRFMTQNGKHAGAGSDTYVNACEFFKKRDMAGLKTPKKRKTASATAKHTVQDLNQIHLDGEEEDAVEVYDSCDEIRRKIGAYLRETGTSQAQFGRDLLTQYHSEKKPAQIQGAQVTKFRGYKGPDTGNTSCVFYAAYVFFEKMRILEKKPKTKHRQEMEIIWGPRGGFDITDSHKGGWICAANTRPVQDQYGRVSFM